MQEQNNTAIISQKIQAKIQQLLKETAYIEQGKYNYKKFLQRLIALGKLLEEQAKASRPEPEPEPEPAPPAISLKQKQYYAVFKKVWMGEGLQKIENNEEINENHINDYGLYVSHKDLDSSVKHQVQLALDALDKTFAITGEVANQANYLSLKALEQLDQSAGEAIETYKTPVQKIFYYTTEALGILTGIAYGVTMIASFYLMLHLLPLLIIGTIVFFVAGAYVNWKMVNEPGYDFLNAIKGKLNPFDGFTEFSNACGKVFQMGTGRKLALVLAFLLALSVGVAQAFFCYSAFITLIGSSIFFAPYVAGFFAVITLICFTYLMFSGFVHLLQSEHPLDFFKKPFEQLLAVFDESETQKAPEARLSPKLLLAQKIIAGVVVALIAAICLAGLIAISIACGQTMTDIMTSFFHVAMKIAVPFSIAIGCVLSAIGEIPFIIENAFRMVTLIIEFGKNTKPLFDEAIDKVGVCKTIFEVSCILLNAFGNALLSVDPVMLAQGKSGLIYTIFGAIAEGLNNLVGAVENYEIEDKREQKQREAASKTRTHSIFMLPPPPPPPPPLTPFKKWRAQKSAILPPPSIPLLGEKSIPQNSQSQTLPKINFFNRSIPTTPNIGKKITRSYSQPTRSTRKISQ